MRREKKKTHGIIVENGKAGALSLPCFCNGNTVANSVNHVERTLKYA